MLKIGQKLWYINKFTGQEEFVIVRDLMADSFEVWYGSSGKHATIQYSEIGTRVFLKPLAQRKTQQKPQKKTSKTAKEKHTTSPKPQLQYITIKTGTPPRVIPPKLLTNFPASPTPSHPPVPQEKTCSRCALRKSGECSSLAEQVCTDFKALQFIPQAEIDSFPEYGDANAIRRKNRKHFKD